MAVCASMCMWTYTRVCWASLSHSAKICFLFWIVDFFSGCRVSLLPQESPSSTELSLSLPVPPFLSLSLSSTFPPHGSSTLRFRPHSSSSTYLQSTDSQHYGRKLQHLPPCPPVVVLFQIFSVFTFKSHSAHLTSAPLRGIPTNVKAIKQRPAIEVLSFQRNTILVNTYSEVLKYLDRLTPLI